MKHYKIAFVGLGSIGKRHLINVSDYLQERQETYTIDLYRSGINKCLSEGTKDLVSNVYLYANGPQDNYDVVFVTNPTSMHYETMRMFKDNAQSFFIEKPVFDSTEIDPCIFEELKNKTCFVACPLRFNSVLQYVHDHVDLKKVIAVRAISSSYLPDWRPGQDYRKCYSAHKDMGGGVGIDLIHEWDYLTYFFGMPETCYSIQDHISNLEIDSDDIAIYIAKAGKTTIEIHLDYFGRKSLRVLEVFMPEETISCDILNGKVSYLNSGETITFVFDRNLFHRKEIEHFFSVIRGEKPNDSTAEHAYDILRLAKGELCF